MGDIIEMIESVRTLLSSEQELEDDEIDGIRGLHKNDNVIHGVNKIP